MEQKDRLGKMDAQLVSESLHGKTTSFDELVRRYQSYVYFYVGQMIKDSHAAEDITQETFVEAFKSLKRCNKPESFKSWLVGIARNLSLMWIRKTSRGAKTTDLALDAITEENPEKFHREQEEIERVEKALATLPSDVEEIFHLRFIQQKKCKEIAQILNKPLSTVLNQLARGYQKLENELLPFWRQDI